MISGGRGGGVLPEEVGVPVGTKICEKSPTFAELATAADKGLEGAALRHAVQPLPTFARLLG